MAGAFETGKYRNVFAEYGYPEAEIQRRVEQTFETIFYGNEEKQRFTMRVMTILPIFMIQGIRMCVQKECPME